MNEWIDGWINVWMDELFILLKFEKQRSAVKGIERNI